MPSERTGALVIGALVGLLVGGLAVGAVAGWVRPPASADSPSYSMTTATGCAEAPTAGGWIGRVETADRAVVVLNYTIVHDAAEVEVSADLDTPAPGEYVLAIESTPVTDSAKGAPPAGCEPRTKVEASLGLPRGFDRLRVILDGRPIATLDGETGPSFRRLSDSAAG